MKTTLIALTLLVGLLAASALTATIAWTVWYAENHAPSAALGPFEQSTAALHTQLAQSAQREAEIEKLYWNQPEKLQVLIQSHQQRIDKLTGNTASAEIVAHDQEAIARLEQRIAAIEAERVAQAQAEAEALKQQQLEARQQAQEDAHSGQAR